MKKRFGKWTFAALCALMLFLAGIPTAAAQSEMPQVILTFDKESVNVGEEVTASYEVVGGEWKLQEFSFRHFGNNERRTGLCAVAYHSVCKL